MSGAGAVRQPQTIGLIVRHAPWCGMAHGMSDSCICSPTTELVDAQTLATQMAHDFRNRAQRRAADKQARRVGR